MMLVFFVFIFYNYFLLLQTRLEMSTSFSPLEVPVQVVKELDVVKGPCFLICYKAHLLPWKCFCLFSSKEGDLNHLSKDASLPSS